MSETAPYYDKTLRQNIDETMKQSRHFLQSSEAISKMLNLMPYIVAIINYNRQIVFSNNALMNFLGIDADKIYGFRLGEVLNCINAFKNPAGCGNSESCMLCGACQSMIECIDTKQEVSKECRITASAKGATEYYDFTVTAIPLYLQDEFYIIITIKDISEIKRKQILERIFFHDVLNSANGLNGLVQIIQMNPQELHKQDTVALLEEINRNLLSSIMSQRDLILAERGDLEVNNEIQSMLTIFKLVILQFKYNMEWRNIKLFIDDASADITINTDTMLLSRVLTNIVKNGLEASNEGQTVSLGCREEDGRAIIWIHNQSYIPPEVQLQIFQRSFSTKGYNRGVGTYSIKLLTERYLKGKVHFVTDEVEGTTFYIELPM